MITRKIQITNVIATSSRYNRIQFSVIEDDGRGGSKTLPVCYPQGRGDDGDSLAVESSVFQLASVLFAATPSGKPALATAQLYVDNRCCCGCSSKIAVEGIYSLSPAQPSAPDRSDSR